MNSQNIEHIALNRQGTLELGQSPCLVCDVGFSSYTGDQVTTCYDSCSYWAIFNDREQMEILTLRK